MLRLNFVPSKLYFPSLLAFFCLYLLCPVSLEAALPTPEPNNSLSKPMVENKIKALNEKQGLDEASKTKIVATYQAIQEQLDSQQQYRDKAAYYQESLQSAPMKLKSLQAEISRLQAPTADKKQESFQAIPTDELEQRYLIEKSKSSDFNVAIEKFNHTIAEQDNRPEAINSEVAAVKQALELAQHKLESLVNQPSDATGKLEAEAQQLLLKAQVDARTTELNMYQLETISNSVRLQLVKANLELTNLKQAALEPVIASIEEQLALRRQQDAQRVSEELLQAEKSVADKPKVIQQLTRENIQFSRELQQLTQQIEPLNTQKAMVEAETRIVAENQKSAHKKVNLADLNPVLGRALREQRSGLRFSDDFILEAQALENKAAQISINQFRVEDKLKRLNDIEQALNKLLAEAVHTKMPSDERLHLKAELRILLNQQKELLEKLNNLYISAIHALNDLVFARQQFTTQANNYAAYLDKHLLWVPSTSAIDLEFLPQVYQATIWLISPVRWGRFIKDSVVSLAKHPFLSAIALLNLLLLYALQMRLTARIAANNSLVLRPTTDRFRYTLLNIIYTALLVAPVALLLNYLGWLLNDLASGSVTKAVGTALRNIAQPLFVTQFLFSLFAIDGIVRKHFHWRKKPIAVIRKQLSIILYLVIPAAFVVSMTYRIENVVYVDTLGRLALIIMLGTISSIIAKLAHPKFEVLPKYILDNPQHWLNKLRWLWYPLFIALPLIIIGFAATGYLESALELTDKLISSLSLIILAVLVHEVAIRWLLMVNRQLTLENARLHESFAEESQEVNLNERLFDISTLNAQTLTILNVLILLGLAFGSWIIWRDTLPAFSILEQVVLWEHHVTLDGQTSAKPITLTNLIIAIIYVAVALITVRNLAGVVELILFRHLEIEAGSRYAIIQLSKYAILTITFLASTSELGGNWAQLQWLIAALGVGLGFGLQEIFANMVSGIILLFERPIRVGDTVTVGDITGIVNRIQIRATTIIDRDQKELIVPNKTFITNQLTNWTLTDPITRVVIPIGIAYGSDIELAHRVMLDTINSIPQILRDPEPSALLIGFGDSTLNFSIRIFVGQLVERAQVTHILHLKLEKAFREHNIVIPYPHQNVHIVREVH